MKRRTALIGLAGGVLAAAAAFVSGEIVGGAVDITPAGGGRSLPRAPEPGYGSRSVPSPLHSPTALSARFDAPRIRRVALPHGTITALPGPGNCVALTVDDGASSEVVRLYAEFATLTGMRLTFFVNGSRPAWTANAKALRPLVESGQVQIGNHTWSHPNLNKLAKAAVESELMTNHDFIQSTYGVDARPYFRPPFGFHSPQVDAIAAGVGYSTPVLWFGSLSDSALISTQQLRGFADQWMLPQHIVIGHANFLPVTECFDYLVALIRARHLQPVTLNDYFSR